MKTKRKKQVKEKVVFKMKNSPAINFDSKSLVVIDNEKLKSKEIQSCKKIITKIDTAKLEIHNFETIDNPAYKSWVNEIFGELIHSIREKTAELDELEFIVESVHELSFKKRLSFHEAYKIVIKRKEAIDNYQKEENDFQWEYTNPEDENEDVFREELNDFFKKFSEEKENDSFHPSTPKINLNNSIKQKYHSIAQKLHPDKNKNPTLEEQRIWNEIQEAYSNSDEIKLDSIIHEYNIRFGNFKNINSIFDLRTTKLKLDSSLKSFQRKIRLLKKEVAWNFKKATQVQKNKLKKEIEKELTELQRDTLRSYNQLSKLVNSWKNEDPRTRNRKSLKEDDFIHFYINY
jgi:hypothetical protein